MQATPLNESNEGQDTDKYLEPALRVSRLETRSLAAEAEVTLHHIDCFSSENISIVGCLVHLL